MSEIDPDIQMPEEEPNTPEDQSAPQPPDETTEADAEETLENMQELIDQIGSLSKESDDDALKEIERQLPQNKEPEEGTSAPDTVESDAGRNAMANQADVPDGEPAIETPESAEDEARNEAVIDSDLVSIDDDLALLLDDIDQVVVQAESEKSVTPGGENPVAGDAMSETMPEALSSPEEPSFQEDLGHELGGISDDTVEAVEVGDSDGLDHEVDEIVSKINTLDATAVPSHASEPSSTDAESVEEIENTSLEADIDVVIAQAFNPSPAETESTSEESTPVESVENDPPPDIGEIAAPGVVESSIDLVSELNALLDQVNEEQRDEPPESISQPFAPAPETVSSAPTGEESELNDLNKDPDDLIVSTQEQPESEENSESSESPAPVEAIDSIAPDTDQSPDIAGEAAPAESEEPKTTPVLEEQKKEVPPTEGAPRSNVPVTPQDMAMRELDEAMADDVAQMIAGDTEALESVLDGIFDEQAILVQNEEDSMNGSVRGGNMQSDQPVGDSGVKLVPPSSSPIEEAADIEEVIDEEIAALGTPETPKEISTTTVSDLPESDQKETNLVVQKPAEATKVADAAEVEAAPGEPQLTPAERESKWQDRVMAAFEIIEPPLVTVLSGLNYPLRKMPERLRPAVDWLALSLVFWVPIVWVLAMFVL